MPKTGPEAQQFDIIELTPESALAVGHLTSEAMDTQHC